MGGELFRYYLQVACASQGGWRRRSLQKYHLLVDWVRCVILLLTLISAVGDLWADSLWTGLSVGRKLSQGETWVGIGRQPTELHLFFLLLAIGSIVIKFSRLLLGWEGISRGGINRCELSSGWWCQSDCLLDWNVLISVQIIPEVVLLLNHGIRWNRIVVPILFNMAQIIYVTRGNSVALHDDAARLFIILDRLVRPLLMLDWRVGPNLQNRVVNWLDTLVALVKPAMTVPIVDHVPADGRLSIHPYLTLGLWHKKCLGKLHDYLICERWLQVLLSLLMDLGSMLSRCCIDRWVFGHSINLAL